MAVIYCFGDSITYGAWDVQGSGWASRLRGYLDGLQEKDDDLYYLTYNLGIPGENTDGFLKRFESELMARSRAGRGPTGPGEAVFIFAFGANDYVYLPATKEFVIPQERFVVNMQSAIDIAKKVSTKIMLLNIPPADEAICMKNYGDRKVRLNKNVETYNSLLADLAKKNSLALVDVYAEYLANDYKKLLSEDGLHPNEKGHKLIFEKVKEAVENLIR
jgi:lysophospholipase L1-like esterase